MNENNYSGTDIHYLLHEASKGNARCAYLAGLEFERLGYNPFFVQAQFRNAAKGGNELAQRKLGILGLRGKLINENCSFSDVTYYEDYDVAIAWLEKAASSNDMISKLILAKCKQLGIGMESDVEAGEAEIKKAVPFLREEDIAGVALLFQYIVSEGRSAAVCISNFFSNAPLYGLAG